MYLWFICLCISRNLDINFFKNLNEAICSGSRNLIMLYAYLTNTYNCNSNTNSPYCINKSRHWHSIFQINLLSLSNNNYNIFIPIKLWDHIINSTFLCNKRASHLCNMYNLTNNTIIFYKITCKKIGHF